MAAAAAVLAAAVFLPARLVAATHAGVPPSAGDVTVRAIPVWEGDTVHGYVEYRFAVRNYSKKHPHKVTISLPHEGRYGYGALSRVSRSAVVGPDMTLTLSVPQMPLDLSGADASVLIDGEEGEPVQMSFPSHGLMGRSSESKCVVLLSRETRHTPYLQGQEKLELAPAQEAVGGWSPNWLAYSRYDGIVVAGREVDAMSPQVRLAIARYVECGGSLLVVGPVEMPIRFSGAEGLAAAHGAHDVVFGRCLLSGTSVTGTVVHTFFRSVEGTYRPWQTVSDVVHAHERFPVVEDISVPVRGMLALMLAFVVAIGPVNILVLGRKRMRIWLFVTVPAISLATCGLVFGYSLVSEGITGRYRTLSLTVLDENTNRATTIGWTAFYSPLTPRRGLHFSYQTELSPQLYRSYGYYYGRSRQSGARRTVDWTENQHLAGGWVQARIPAHFKIRKSENRRERLTVRKGGDGRLRVVNGFGVRIRRLVLADEKGGLHEANDVPAGAETPLEPSTAQLQAGASMRQVYAADWLERIPQLERQPEAYLRPGTYIACFDETPFVEKALEWARAEKCSAFVYGISKRTEDAGPG